MEKLQNFYNELDEDTVVKSVLGIGVLSLGLWKLEDWYRERQKNQPLKDKINLLWNEDPKEVSVGVKYISDKATSSEEKENLVDFGSFFFFKKIFFNIIILHQVLYKD